MAFGKLGAWGSFGALGGLGGSGGPPNTLRAATGAFILIGKAVAFLGPVNMPAGTGAFVVTGDPMTPAFSMGADLGVFTLTGIAAGLLGANTIGAGTGIFVETGIAATLSLSMPAAKGTFTLTGIAATLTAPNTYTGPGDIYSFVAWYGLRAYNAAYATGSNPAIDIVDQASANLLTVNINSSGDLDTAAVSAWVTAHSVTEIHITKAYDQTGNGNHATQATLNITPRLVLSATANSKPVMRTVDTASGLFSSSLTQTVPVTVSAYALKNVAQSGSVGIIIGDNSTAGWFTFTNNANEVEIYSSGVQVVLGSVADGSYHALQFFASTSASSCKISVDGTSATPAGSVGGNWNGPIGLFSGGQGAFHLMGDIAEAGIASGDHTSSNSTMNSNQHAYWG